MTSFKILGQGVLATLITGINTLLVVGLKNPPPPTPTGSEGLFSTDFGPYINLTTIILGILGTVLTVYFFYLGRVTRPNRIEEKTVDPAIEVLGIERQALTEPRWKFVLRSLRLQTGVSIVNDILLVIAFVIANGIVTRESGLSWLTVFLIGEGIFIVILSLITIRNDRFIISTLGDSPEDARDTIMASATLSVMAHYRYLFAKTQWSLRQMNITVFDETAGSPTIVSMIGRRSFFRSYNGRLRITITPEEDEPGTYSIAIDCFTPQRKRRNSWHYLYEGTIINRFIDLMGSNGFTIDYPDL